MFEINKPHLQVLSRQPGAHSSGPSDMLLVQIHRHKDGSADYAFFFKFIGVVERRRRRRVIPPRRIDLMDVLWASDPVALAAAHSAALVRSESPVERQSSWPLPATARRPCWLRGRLSESLFSSLVCGGTGLFQLQPTQPSLVGAVEGPLKCL